MLLLTSTSDKIQVITSTTAGIDVHASWIDLASGTVSAGRTNTKITTATTTDVVASPAASTARNVKTLHVQNIHASTANVVTVQHTDGTNTIVLESVSLAAGERIAYVEGQGFELVDALGVTKTPASVLPSGIGTTAAIASHSADTYYLGMPVAGRLLAGCFFRWSWRSTKGAAGTAAPTYIIRYGTAGTTADTARLTLTGTAQTAAADSAKFLVEVNFRVIGASAVIQGSVWIDHFLATTGFTTTTQNHAMVEGTSAAFDSSPANSIIGLSVNPGASGAWVTNQVTLDGTGLLGG